MWTEREKYIASNQLIEKYLESVDEFHDNRIGNIYYKNNEIVITVEDIISETRNSGPSGLIWDFRCNDIVDFEMDCDCVVGYYINEITLNNNYLIFNCTNGTITIQANRIQLGIPSKINN